MKWPTQQALASLSRHYRALLRRSARCAALCDGEILHAAIVTTGLSAIPNSYTLNTLLSLYSKCGHFVYAHKVFDEIPHSHKDTVDWTTLINCYTHLKMPVNALSLFRNMREFGVNPDEVTMICVFGACAQLDDSLIGDCGVGCMVKMGVCFGVKVWNSMIDMYVKCGLMGEARRVFEEMEERSAVTWTVLLDGVLKWDGLVEGRKVFDEMPERNDVACTIMSRAYVENGFSKKAFAVLEEMVFRCKYMLSFVALCSILTGCAQSGDLMMGRWLHLYAFKMMGGEMDTMVGTALVDMYAKCGRVETALRVFKKIRCRNVVTWNAMFSGLAVHGMGNVLLEMFPSMLKESKPDHVTMTSVLSACSHSGLVDQGRYYFSIMRSVFGTVPQIEHYACMVDLLGRAGLVEEAETLVKDMPIPPNEVVLGSLLGSCYTYRKFDIAENLLQDLIKTNPNNTECHVLLSNMYRLAGNRDKSNHLRKVLNEKGIKKVPGTSSIHVSGQVHRFFAGDKSHPMAQSIYMKLDEVIRKLKSAGYVPLTSSQVVSACDGDKYGEESEEKEQALFTHSEKLAVCFGLINTKPGTPLYIFKNLRICIDCHLALKVISRVYEREIVIRDRSRFHCFKHGSCSCADYW